MSWHRFVGSLFLFCAGAAAAEGYVFALGAEADTEESLAVSAFGELGIGEQTWASAGAATSRSEGPDGGFDALYADAGIDHFFEPIGVRFAAAYWGDSDVLDSVDLRASIYMKNDRFSLSGELERRAYDLVVGPPLLLRPRIVELSADGIGFSTRLQAGERVSLYAGGMWYDYAHDVRAQPGVADLRFLALTRLILAQGLLDSKAHAGVEVELGPGSLDLRYAKWTALADQGEIDSLGIGFLTPLTDSSDLELRLSRDRSDAFGDSTVLSVFLYFFGD